MFSVKSIRKVLFASIVVALLMAVSVVAFGDAAPRNSVGSASGGGSVGLVP